MTQYQKGDLVLVAFPFSGGGQIKRRPALVLLDTGDADFVLARVTTQLPASSMDVEIVDWKAAGLLAPSVVRLHKLATLEKALASRHLGQLSASDRQRVAAALSQAFGAW